MIELIKSIIPPLSEEYHKGQAGRIGIFGGSKNFTGAPYFASISALRTGCDLIYVFCTKDASQAIKTYSPELMVHPVLDDPNFKEEIANPLSLLHSIVIGPGLGREEFIFDNTRHTILTAKEHNLPIVLDADALFYLNSSPNEILSYEKAILTPNVIEFKRLYHSVTKKELYDKPSLTDVEELSRLLGNVTIVCKGSEDIISNGVTTLTCNERGSPRRCGGQGDILAGTMGVFNYWSHRAFVENSSSATMLAAMAACMLTRRCNYLAFQKLQRSMTTSDMLFEIHSAFSSLFC